MRIILLAASAMASLTAASAQATPLELAEPYFMQANYAKAFAIVRDYNPDPRSLRLDFVFGVSACLSGEDHDRALGLMMLNAIATSYRLTTAQAAKLSSYMAHCQPADAIVNTSTVADSNASGGGLVLASGESGSGVSTHETAYMKKYPNTRQIPLLQAIEAKRLESEFVGANAGVVTAAPTASQIMRFNRATLLHVRPVTSTPAPPPKP